MIVSNAEFNEHSLIFTEMDNYIPHTFRLGTFELNFTGQITVYLYIIIYIAHMLLQISNRIIRLRQVCIKYTPYQHSLLASLPAPQTRIPTP